MRTPKSEIPPAFVLGGRGFYGSGFVRRLAALGREVQVITRENYDAFRGRRCGVFINAAGNSSKLLARRAPLEDFEASVRSVRASLVDFRYDAYVYLSSIDVYPDCSPHGANRETTIIDPQAASPYGFHKWLAEQCVRHVAGRWLIARLGGAVGPGLRKNAIYDILNGGPLWLDPASRLQFLRTDEAAGLILNLLDRGIHGEIVNVCGSGTIALEEVLAELKTEVPVQPESPRVHCEVDLSRLRSLLPIPETRTSVLDFVRTAAILTAKPAA